MTNNKPEMPKDCIYIGKDRQITDYVLPIVTMLNNGIKEITVKSRGTCNNNNLSLNQYLLNRVMKNQLKVKSVDIGTEVLKNKDNRDVNVTTLTIIYLKVG